jgi:ABC-type sugar transport system ATPase subunit
MSDRVAVVRDGRILEITSGAQLSEYQLIGMASGVGESEDGERTTAED